jgi:hypothetical protein
LLATTLLMLLASEVALRLLAGQSVVELELQLGSPKAVLHDMTPFVTPELLAAGTNPSWINVEPPALEGRDTIDPELLGWRDASRSAKWRGLESNLYRQWNAAWLRTEGCGSRSPVRGLPVPIYEFDSPDGSTMPAYRYFPRRTDPLGMRTNGFGWRGPEIPLNKPAATVRLAFVGASTTVGSKHCPASYPEYVIHWLNLWARANHPGLHFDGLNAGREGLNSEHIAAIVRTEVLPMEPDLVVYYEGVNDLGNWLRRNLQTPKPPQLPTREESAFDKVLVKFGRYSMLGTRLHEAIADYRTPEAEFFRPPHAMPWQETSQKTDPNPFDPSLPFWTPNIIRNLDALQSLLASQDTEFAIGSFVFLTDGKITRDGRDNNRFELFYRNFLWPLTYDEIRRIADFQSRVFRAFSQSRDVEFIDLAAAYPHAPELFLDGVHFHCNGIRLQAWIVMQKLLPLIDRHLASGHWPRTDGTPLETHPGISPPRQVDLECPDIEPVAPH